MRRPPFAAFPASRNRHLGAAAKRGASLAALGLALLALPPEAMSPRVGEAAAPSKAAAAPAAGAEGFSSRKAAYLERTLATLRRLDRRGGLDEYRMGEAAVAAAARAAVDPAAGADAARWVEGALARCAPAWRKVDCERAELALQRVALQFPGAMPAELRARLRQAVSAAAPPPPATAVAAPWDFRETENQRIIRAARSLGAFAVRGTPDAPAARAWADATAAFLDAHARSGWYEAESPGYLGFSISGLLHLADFAPRADVKDKARRELTRLFASWARLQVGGFPAGPKSRAYVHWALGTRNTPWVGWAWLLAGMGDAETIGFLDWPELAVSTYEVPLAVRRQLLERRTLPPYEVTERRTIPLPSRRSLDAALYSYATPDYVLGAAQSVQGLTLGVSGGQEIALTLFAEGAEFAPLYLWSRIQNVRSERWKSATTEDAVVAHRNLALARLGGGGPGSVGYAYLSSPWGKPEILPKKDGTAGETLVARAGPTYVALTAAGGWETALAAERFPDYFGGDVHFRAAWVAVPRRQPAAVALEVGRQAEVGDFAAWKARAARSRLEIEGERLQLEAGDGRRLSFLPGRQAEIAGKALDARAYPPGR
jgi:hypothetical protein